MRLLANALTLLAAAMTSALPLPMTGRGLTHNSDACLHDTAADSLERANANVRLSLFEVDGRVTLQAINLRPVVSELIMTGLDPDSETTQSLRLLPLSTTPVMDLGETTRDTAREQLQASWRFRSMMGYPGDVSPDSEYVYGLPFRSGASYRLSQGFFGSQSHESEASRYALDFQLEVGDPVHAAREGLVVRAVDWFCRSGGRELVDQANLIIILHDDGTMAHYVHLDHNSVLVSEGDHVARGQHIGNAGMTGFTGGPHLHFVVRRESDIAIPIRFEGYEEQDLSRRGRFRNP